MSETRTGPAGSDRRPPRWARALLWLVVVGVAVGVLFLWVFPWVESLQQDPTMGLQELRAAR